jgi:hypothetical protein
MYGRMIFGTYSYGFLGFGLYSTVSFLFTSYPDINDRHGDWVWPATIGAGMAWSIGFIFGGIAWHHLHKKAGSILLLRIIYILILWLWAGFIWYLIICSNLKPL